MQASRKVATPLDFVEVGKVYDTLVHAIEAAERRGETRYQIARRTGVSQATLSRIVNRNTESIALDTLERLVEALGIEIRIRKG